MTDKQPPIMLRFNTRSSTTLRGSDATATTTKTMVVASDTMTPTELARAHAFQHLHRDSSEANAAAASSALTANGSTSNNVQETHEAAAAHTHGTSHAFLITYFVAGGAAGATSRTVVSPLERLKIIMQVQPQMPKPSSSSSPLSASAKAAAAAANKRAYSGVWTGLVKMWQEEGFAGFMRGNGINCLRIAPYSAVQFTTYEMCKTWLRDDETGELDVVRKLTAGAIAGIASVVSTYPLDLVRSRISIASANMYNEAKTEAITTTTISNSGVKAKGVAKRFRKRY